MRVKRILWIAGILVISIRGLIDQERADLRTIENFLEENGYDDAWLETFKTRRSEEKRRVSELQKRREAAGHPIAVDRDEPMPAGFPRGVYGSELLGAHVAHLLALARIMNTLALVRGIQNGEIEAEELSRQLLGLNINFTGLSDVYKKRYISGFPEHRQFEALVANLSGEVASESDRDTLNDVLSILADLDERNVSGTVSDATSFSLSDYVRKVEKLLSPTVLSKSDLAVISDLHELLKELDGLTRKEHDLLIEDTQKVTEWFEEHKSSEKFRRPSFEGKDGVSVLLRNPVKLCLEAIGTIQKEEKSMEKLKSWDAGSFEQDMKNVEAVRDSSAVSNLLSVLLRVRDLSKSVVEGNYQPTNLSLLPGLPNKIEDVRAVLDDFMLGWIENLIGESPFVQLFLLLEPIQPLLRVQLSLGNVFRKVKRDVKKYGEKCDALIGYLQKLDENLKQLPRDSLFPEFENVRNCLNKMSTLDNVTEDLRNLEEVRIGVDDVIGLIREKADRFSTLERIKEDGVLTAFQNPDLENITKTVAETIWYIDFQKLGQLSSSIQSGALFETIEKDNRTQHFLERQGTLSGLIETAMTKVKKTSFAEALDCVSKERSIEKLLPLIDSSKFIREHGQLDVVWHAVSAYQSFLKTEENVGKMLKMHGELKQFQNKTGYPVTDVLAKSQFTLEDVGILMDGVTSFQLLADSFDMKEQLILWNRTLARSFGSVENGEKRERIGREWNRFVLEFDKFVDGLDVIEHFLYSAEKASLADNMEVFRIASELPRRYFKLDEIISILEKRHAEAPEFIVRIKKYQKMSEEWSSHVDSLRNAASVLKKMRKWSRTVMNATLVSWKKEEVRDKEKLKGLNYLNCYCGEISGPEDPCFQYCDDSELIQQIEEEERRARDPVEKHSWWWILPLIVFTVAVIAVIDLAIRNRFESDREDVYKG